MITKLLETRPLRYHHYGFILIMCLITGCAVPTCDVEEGQTGDPTCALYKASDEAQAGQTFRTSEWIDDAWWQMFGDEQLNEIITRSLSKNPSLKVSEAKALLANAEAKTTAAILYPFLDANADALRYHISHTGPFGKIPPTTFPFNYTQYDLNLQFSWEIDWWGKNWNALRAAIGEVQASIADTAQARLALSVTVAEAYFRYQIDLRRMKLAQRLVENLQRTVELVKFRIKQGLETDITLNVTLGGLLNAKDKLIALEQDALLMEDRLRMYLAGEFLDEFEEAEGLIGLKAPFPLPAELPLDLLSHRPDITAQIWRVEKAARNINVARAQFYPNLNIMGLIGFQTISIKKLFEGDSLQGNGGPAIHLPIFEGGRLRANLEGAQWEYAIAVNQYNDLVFHAVADTLDAIISLQKLNTRLQDVGDVTKTFEENNRLFKQRLKHNLSSELDVLVSERDVLSSQDAEWVLQFSIDQAMLGLINALGGGYSAQYESCTNDKKN